MTFKARISILYLHSILLLSPLALNAQSQYAPNKNPDLERPTNAELEMKAAHMEAAGVASVEWNYHKTSDGAHPNANEQQMLWLMNRARSNPTQEGIWLADKISLSNVNNAITAFNVDKDVLKQEFALIDPAPPAAFDCRIYQGSKMHSDDLITRDAQDHTNQITRIADAGFTHSGIAVSVYSYSLDPIYAHAGFNIDWGGNDGTGMQTGRGHRKALMDTSFSSFSLTNVGIAMVAENNNSTSVGPLITSIGYARARNLTNQYNIFITGTIWTDANGNDLYDPGEGQAGVNISADKGDFFAVTGNAGGFAIPATENGTYTLTISGGAIPTPEQRTVEVAGESVLMIWNSSDDWLPDLVTGPIPKLCYKRASSTRQYTWQNPTNTPVKLQRSTNLITWNDDTRQIIQDAENYSFDILAMDLNQSAFFKLTYDQ